ncbi:glycerol-3-phosphate acyltransferase PlsY [Methylacidimicrobium cyclopophantes]|uniref:Glycerol-3-phosphate acyltransferase n=1 Tax=Methylacidimicrobium cyclopophantes TaxID=1041766 RepID=A0A5E6MEV9_9BACT|nr:glycerol-3-phosphate 1-O-acyltransferase PlsY [Methylacidimicrobium cyclopophantes]VVM06896.1 glycerol-3-phosphate acyltransferase PlsY [Methylacidimicrobium cyclopophantes]
MGTFTMSPLSLSQMGWATALLFASFLLGSIPFGYCIGRLRGIDLRTQGSGNIGATNAWRILGARWGCGIFVLDFLKGALPAIGGLHFSPALSVPMTDLLGSLAGLAAILGHNFTPWLRGRGGKGIATSAGVLLALTPWAFLVVLGTWASLFLLCRIVSLASLGAALIFPIATGLLYPGRSVLLAFSIFASLLAILRHRSNIRRLIQGQESRFGRKNQNDLSGA